MCLLMESLNICPSVEIFESLCFQVLDVIARGAYGNVLKVRREDDKKLYAVKVIAILYSDFDYY